jgi:hypothetical protein
MLGQEDGRLEHSRFPGQPKDYASQVASSFRIHLRPDRSVFSNALNFCRSAIAVLVRSP